jgi:hypothetical protein
LPFGHHWRGAREQWISIERPTAGAIPATGRATIITEILREWRDVNSISGDVRNARAELCEAVVLPRDEDAA